MSGFDDPPVTFRVIAEMARDGDLYMLKRLKARGEFGFLRAGERMWEAYFNGHDGFWSSTYGATPREVLMKMWNNLRIR